MNDISSNSNFNNFANIKNEAFKDSRFFGNSFNSSYNTSNDIDKLLLLKSLSERNICSNNGNYNNDKDIDYKLLFILKKLNLAFLMNAFAKNYVKFNDLFLLTREDLIEMKIPIGPRNKLLHFIQEYKKHMKNLDLDEITNFFKLYKSNFVFFPDMKISDNNPPSTIPTTNNDISYRIKANGNLNNLLLNNNNKKDEKNQSFNYSYICHDNTKENFNQNNNNNSLLNSSSYNYKNTNSGNNGINIYKRNSPYLKNLKTSSYITSNINENNKNDNEMNKTKNSNSDINNNKENDLSKSNQNTKKDIENINLNISKDNKKLRGSNRNYYLRNPLIKLIEDSQTNRTYSIINGQLVDGSNCKIVNNNKKYRNNNENNKKNDNSLKNNYVHINKKEDKKNKNENKRVKKLIKSKSNTVISNSKNNNNSICNNGITNSLLIENFKNINFEVEIFQNQCKRMKRESYDRKNRIKILLKEEKKSSWKIKLIKQQIKDIEQSYKLKDLKNENLNDINAINNICQNKNCNYFNNNISNNTTNNLKYEFNMECVK